MSRRFVRDGPDTRYEHRHLPYVGKKTPWTPDPQRTWVPLLQNTTSDRDCLICASVLRCQSFQESGTKPNLLACFQLTQQSTMPLYQPYICRAQRRFPLHWLIHCRKTDQPLRNTMAGCAPRWHENPCTVLPLHSLWRKICAVCSAPCTHVNLWPVDSYQKLPV